MRLIWHKKGGGVLYYPRSENNGTDQLCGYYTADLRLFFEYAKVRFYDDAAQNIRWCFVCAIKKSNYDTQDLIDRQNDRKML